MVELMVSAPASGSGKTVLTCALLSALKHRGLDPCAFKCGPDYIDPMFHRSALGVDSCNLDLFLSGEDTVRALYRRCGGGRGAAVVEGAMGFYDGLGGTTDRASAWHAAHTLDLPVLLAVRPRGASLTLAAQIGGLLEFRTPSHIAGLFLTDCSPTLAKSLAPMLEGETGLPVVGHLPHMAEAVLESRHLGLHTAGEIGDLAARIGRAAQVLDEAMDWDRFFALFDRRPGWEAPPPRHGAETVPLAVARDEAFCFTYAETLDALRDAGAELVFFSPLRDEKLPENACGLYLPGGYPELYAAQLAENQSMRDSIKGAVAGRMPTAAECGGFLYLGQSLEGTDGRTWPMAGYLPGEGVKQDRLVRFGYANLSAPSDSLLFEAGEPVPVHEFHYWDSTRNGEDLTASKPLTGRSWTCGFVSDRLYAAFPHLYFAGRPELAERFVRAAKHYRKERSRHE
ncbi:MAG: cobyrinate a,c-diamide synthase [Oscillospiraceae bacterium]|nr:cobyrinate a,c-diamide synthase [Oscillospiraceae bacterium]MCI9307982.1 cobyrinate a,c-diamide synthase [Oscillospiraceae bacterium]